MPFKDPEKQRESVRKAEAKALAADPDGFRVRKRAAVAKSYQKHADKRRAGQRARSRTPEAKEKARLYAQQWRAANPSYARRAIWKRRGAKYEQDNGYAEILLNDPCSYCGKTAGEIDHIEPIATGGGSDWENFTSACQFCNRSKNDRSLLNHLIRRRSCAA